MKVIEGTPGNPASGHSIEPYGPLRARWELFKNGVRWRVRRWIPRLVWYDDEVDVTITFSEDPLRHGDEISGLFSGGLHEIRQQLRHMGITFDTGQGDAGRDWEFDWSLRGPVSVRFRGRARNPERRVRPKKPSLRAVD